MNKRKLARLIASGEKVKVEIIHATWVKYIARVVLLDRIDPNTKHCDMKIIKNWFGKTKYFKSLDEVKDFFYSISLLDDVYLIHTYPHAEIAGMEGSRGSQSVDDGIKVSLRD